MQHINTLPLLITQVTIVNEGTRSLVFHNLFVNNHIYLSLSVAQRDNNTSVTVTIIKILLL